MEVRDELAAALEHLQQRDWPVLAGQRDRRIHLDHRQPPPGRRDRVAFPGVGLLPHQQLVQLCLPAGPVGHLRHRCGTLGYWSPLVPRLTVHDRLRALPGWTLSV